ncbi:hypothetical protein F4680DRAFT_363389 [Xylaria scruposa]|nr:hypothetical protein F4680DRAFT_363389 [Xylaria scruposa]
MADPQPDRGSPPDLPPSFFEFPLLRTTLFLAGLDMKQTVGEFRRNNYRYLRGVFNVLSVNQYPDTSSTKRIITSSVVEVVSAISIVSLVAVFVRMYYTRSGASLDTGLGLGPAIEVPILAAFFTLFALIVAALTWLSMGEVVRTSRLGSFIPLTSPEPEICMVCLEKEPITNLVNLQCHSDEVEAANPQRKFHYFHEGCIESWWIANEKLAGRCPVCSQTALAYRTVDGEYRYPAPSPSSFVWATYSFFACVQFFFGSRSPIATRQLPRWQNSLSEHFTLVLLRGVGSLCLILFSRLFYAKALYAYYLLLPRWFNEYPAPRLYEYLKTTFAFDLVSGLVHRIRSLAGPHMNQSQIGYIKYVLEWVKSCFLSPDIGPAEDWSSRILIVVLSFVFIHGFARRMGDFIYALTLPRFVGHEVSGRQSASMSLFLQRIRALWFGLSLLRKLWLILKAFFTSVIGSSLISSTPLIAYIKNEFLRLSPNWAWVLLAVTTPSAYVLCFVLYLGCLTVWLTIWEELYWQVVALALTRAAAKLCVSFWPAAIAFDSLQGHGALILTGFFWLPMVTNKIRRAWFPLP